MPGAVELIKKTKRETPEVRTGWNMVAPRVESGGKRTTHAMLWHHSMIHSHELLILNAYGASCWNVTAWANSSRASTLDTKQNRELGARSPLDPTPAFGKQDPLSYSPPTFFHRKTRWLGILFSARLRSSRRVRLISLEFTQPCRYQND
jgi:hypothetical protein